MLTKIDTCQSFFVLLQDTLRVIFFILLLYACTENLRLLTPIISSQKRVIDLYKIILYRLELLTVIKYY